MPANRYSIFSEIVALVESQIANINNPRGYTKEILLSHIRKQITSLGKSNAVSSDRALRFTFEPENQNDSTYYDKAIYENVSNIKFDYGISLNNIAQVGSIESVAKAIYNRQIALLTLIWNFTGTVGEPIIDVSLDKDCTMGETFRGKFLNNSGVIDPIENGTEIDISGIPSRTFSIKWSFPINSNYVIKDTIARVLLVDADIITQRQNEIAHLASAEILANEAMRALKEGQSETYVNFLNEHSKRNYEAAKGVLGETSPPSPEINIASHSYNYVDKFANRFSKRQPVQWVEVTGTDVKVLRYIE